MTAAIRGERTPSDPFERFTAAQGETPGTVLHRDTDRDLAYVWFASSPDPIDESPRESGMETSALTVHTSDGQCVAYLRISYATAAMIKTTFPRLLAWAEEALGWRMGFGAEKRGYGEPLTPARLWQQAHLHANKTPASLMAADRYVGPWSLSKADVPTDPKVLEADLAVIEKALRPQYNRWRKFLSVPFVAYAATLGNVGEPGSYQRTGVGRTMYVLAAQQLATMGMVLRASGNQSDDAQGLWASMLANPNVSTGTVTVPNWVTGKKATHATLDYR